MEPFWYVPFLVATLILIVLLSFDRGFWATTVVVATLLVAHFFGFVDIINTIKNNAGWFALSALVYVVIGVAWSFIKWILFLYKAKREYKEKIANSNANLRVKTKYEIEPDDDPYRKEHIIPQASDNKGRISTWFFYWPFSMISTMIKDFIVELFNIIYDHIKGWYQEIANKIFEDVAK